ncbi:MAG: YceI family protein [Thermoanaerobaculia bacterium]
MTKAFLKTILYAGTIAGLTAASASAQMSFPSDLSLASSSRIWFDGTSNVRSFSCAAKKLDLDIASTADASPANFVKSASLSIPVALIDCKNGTMNDHMREALKVDKNPAITWKMSSYKVDGTNVEIDGTLTIAGKENPIVLRGTGAAENGTVTLRGTKVLKMTDYGVKPPSLMFGTMKVADAVTVSYDLVLNQ